MNPAPCRCLLVAALFAASVASGCGDKPAAPSTPEGPPPNRLTDPARPGPQPPGPEEKVPQPTPKKGEDLLAAKVDLKMTPKEMGDALGKNFKDQLEFLDRNRDKVIEVTGVIDSYDYFGPGDMGSFFLKNANLVRFEMAEPHPMAKAVTGQTVTLRARCLGSFRGFGGWAIVRVEGDPPPTISAEQIAKQYQADPEATTKKYKDKHIIFTGTIQKIEEDTGTTIHLSGPGMKPVVACHFGVSGSDAAERNGWLKIGATVRVLGMWLSDKPELGGGCVILPPVK
jgi:hypothetical protein